MQPSGIFKRLIDTNSILPDNSEYWHQGLGKAAATSVN
jgi:hypothetical protein